MAHDLCYIGIATAFSCILPLLDEASKRPMTALLAFKFKGILIEDDIARIMKLPPAVVRECCIEDYEDLVDVTPRTKCPGTGGLGYGTKYDAVILDLLTAQECYPDPEHAGFTLCPYYTNYSLLKAVRAQTKIPTLSHNWLKRRLQVLGYTVTSQV